MDQLPKVAQNEIWQYVRGDRAYWKQQFTKVVDDMAFDGWDCRFHYVQVKLVNEEFDVRVMQFEGGERDVIACGRGFIMHAKNWSYDYNRPIHIPYDKVNEAIDKFAANIKAGIYRHLDY